MAEIEDSRAFIIYRYHITDIQADATDALLFLLLCISIFTVEFGIRICIVSD